MFIKNLENFSTRLVKTLKEQGYISDRSHCGISVKELAELCGCTMEAARQYVIAKRYPTIENIFKISEWLSVSPEWLLFGADSKDTPDEQENTFDKELLEYALNNLLGEQYPHLMRLVEQVSALKATIQIKKEMIDIGLNLVSANKSKSAAV